MHYDMKRIGSVIQHARRENGLTQAELAEKIEVSLKTVIDIEKGKRNPTFDVLYRLIITLDIPSELIFRPEDMTGSPELEQFICELRNANEQERRMAMITARGIWQELRSHEEAFAETISIQ